MPIGVGLARDGVGEALSGHSLVRIVVALDAVAVEYGLDFAGEAKTARRSIERLELLEPCTQGEGRLARHGGGGGRGLVIMAPDARLRFPGLKGAPASHG